MRSDYRAVPVGRAGWAWRAAECTWTRAVWAIVAAAVFPNSSPVAIPARERFWNWSDMSARALLHNVILHDRRRRHLQQGADYGYNARLSVHASRASRVRPSGHRRRLFLTALLPTVCSCAAGRKGGVDAGGSIWLRSPWRVYPRARKSSRQRTIPIDGGVAAFICFAVARRRRRVTTERSVALAFKQYTISAAIAYGIVRPRPPHVGHVPAATVVPFSSGTCTQP